MTQVVLKGPHSHASVSAALDTGAMVTCIDQRLAVEHELTRTEAELPMLTWLQNQHIQCYGAYILPLKFRDSKGVAQKHDVLAYGVDRAEPPLLIGRHTLKKLGIDIENGTDSWRWGLRDSQLSRISVETLKKEIRGGAQPVLVGWLSFTPGPDGAVQVLSTKAELHRRLSAQMEEAPLPPELEQYRDMFDNDSAAMLPTHRVTDHAINIKDGKEAPHGPLYNLSQRELGVLREYLQKEVERGRVVRSTSPAGAPIIFVPKKDGTLRLCVDYRVRCHSSTRPWTGSKVRNSSPRWISKMRTTAYGSEQVMSGRRRSGRGTGTSSITSCLLD